MIKRIITNTIADVFTVSTNEDSNLSGQLVVSDVFETYDFAFANVTFDDLVDDVYSPYILNDSMMIRGLTLEDLSDVTVKKIEWSDGDLARMSFKQKVYMTLL